MAPRAGSAFALSFFTLSVLLTILVASDIAHAATLRVCQDGCGYGSVQEAVDAANPGDLIQVQSGVYREAVELDKKLTLRGVVMGDKGMPIIDACGRKNAITLLVDDAVLEGMSLVNASLAGIRILSGENIVRYNSAANNGLSGIEDRGRGKNRISGNVIKANSFGILLLGSDGNDIQGNDAKENVYGIALFESDGNRIRGNLARYNEKVGIILRGSGENTVASNVAGGNRYGVVLDASSRKNLLFENDLSGNYVSDAYDLAKDNQWDNGFVGNNYTVDAGDWNPDPWSTCGCGPVYTVPGGSSVDRCPQVPACQSCGYDWKAIDNMTCPMGRWDKLFLRN